MKITCPHCESTIPQDRVEVSNDLAICPVCKERLELPSANDLQVIENPPDGASFAEDDDGMTAVISIRSLFMIITIPCFCIVTIAIAVCVYIFFAYFDKEHVAELIQVIPFLLIYAHLTYKTLMHTFGKVVVESRDGKCRIFTGFGKIGWPRYFKWSDISEIYQEPPYYQIVLKGKYWHLEVSTDPMGIRSKFLLSALRYMKVEAEQKK